MGRLCSTTVKTFFLKVATNSGCFLWRVICSVYFGDWQCQDSVVNLRNRWWHSWAFRILNRTPNVPTICVFWFSPIVLAVYFLAEISLAAIVRVLVCSSRYDWVPSKWFLLTWAGDIWKRSMGCPCNTTLVLSNEAKAVLHFLKIVPK